MERLRGFTPGRHPGNASVAFGAPICDLAAKGGVHRAIAAACRDDAERVGCGDPIAALSIPSRRKCKAKVRGRERENQRRRYRAVSAGYLLSSAILRVPAAARDAAQWLTYRCCWSTKASLEVIAGNGNPIASPISDDSSTTTIIGSSRFQVCPPRMRDRAGNLHAIRAVHTSSFGRLRVVMRTAGDPRPIAAGYPIR